MLAARRRVGKVLVRRYLSILSAIHSVAIPIILEVAFDTTWSSGAGPHTISVLIHRLLPLAWKWRIDEAADIVVIPTLSSTYSVRARTQQDVDAQTSIAVVGEHHLFHAKHNKKLFVC